MTAQTRRARVTAYVTLAIVLLVGIGLAVFVGPAVYSTRNNTDQVRVGNELAACRSEARADVDDASARLEVANSRLVSLLPEGIEAAMNDPARLERVLADARAAGADAEDALVSLQAATDRYRAAVVASRDAPERFLADCQGD